MKKPSQPRRVATAPQSRLRGTPNGARIAGMAPRLCIVLSCFSLATLGSCSSGTQATSKCVPGASATCTCPTGQRGAQMCEANGTRYDACTCLSVATGGATTATGGYSAAGGTTSAPASTGGIGGAGGASAAITGTGGQASTSDAGSDVRDAAQAPEVAALDSMQPGPAFTIETPTSGQRILAPSAQHRHSP
jgi:hypothetical protein